MWTLAGHGGVLVIRMGRSLIMTRLLFPEVYGLMTLVWAVLTGLQMFDSFHSLHAHLTRHNNWEIHPVFGLEYCPRNKTCTAGSNANWKNLEQ